MTRTRDVTASGASRTQPGFVRHRSVSVGHAASRLVAGVATACLVSCATTPASTPVLLSVDVQAGQPSVPTWPGGDERVEILLDATTSASRDRVGDVSALAAARTLAARWLRELPADTATTLHSLVGSRGQGAEQCSSDDASVIRETASPAALAASAGAIAARGEVSISGALVALGDRLASEGALARAHVVVISDLDDTCTGDLCEAAARLVAGGATLDVVAVGSHEAPACLADVLVPSSAPTPIAVQGRLAPPRVRVVPSAAFVAGGIVAERATVNGTADGTPFSVPGGEVFVRIELTPAFAIGPIVLAPGATHRLRVLDFPAASPPAREWRLDSEAVPMPGRKPEIP